MEKTAKKSEKKLLLRLPTKIWERILKASNKNSRSVNGEIVHSLREKFEI